MPSGNVLWKRTTILRDDKGKWNKATPAIRQDVIEKCGESGWPSRRGLRSRVSGVSGVYESCRWRLVSGRLRRFRSKNSTHPNFNCWNYYAGHVEIFKFKGLFDVTFLSGVNKITDQNAISMSKFVINITGELFVC